MAAQRIAWMDQARAVAICLVALGHGLRAIDRTGALGFAGGPLAIVDKAIYSFHMPLFFLLAGMAARLSTRRDFPTMARSLLVGCLWPYVLWTLIVVGLKAAANGFAGETAVHVDLATALLVHPVDQMWFLYTLFLVRLAWIGVDAAGRLGRRLAVFLSFAIAFTGNAPTMDVFGLWLFFWAAFYGAGRLVGPEAVTAASPRSRLAAAAAALLVWLAALAWPGADLAPHFGPIRTTFGLAGCVAAISLLSLLPPVRGPLGRIVGLVGEASMAIYLTHTLIGAAVRILFARAGWHDGAPLVVVYVLAGLALPTAAHVALVAAGARLRLPLLALAGFGMARGSAYFDLAAGRERQVRIDARHQ